jgi:hypothetical protein
VWCVAREPWVCVAVRCLSFFMQAEGEPASSPDPHYQAALKFSQQDCQLLISQATSTHLTAQDRPHCEIYCTMTALTQMC